MNIFILDNNIEKCAHYHADQHVRKMILESAQMLCTALNESGKSSPYKSTHINHPCNIWVRDSLSNWLWLQRLTEALHDEYLYRFHPDKDHASALVAGKLSPPPLEEKGLTEFPQAMPDQYKLPGDAVAAYRAFYIVEKSRFATWTRRRRPRRFREALDR